MEAPMSEDHLLDAEELAKRLYATKSTVYRMANKGLIPSIPIGPALSGRRFSFTAVCEALQRLPVVKRTYHPPKDKGKDGDGVMRTNVPAQNKTASNAATSDAANTKGTTTRERHTSAIGTPGQGR